MKTEEEQVTEPSSEEESVETSEEEQVTKPSTSTDRYKSFLEKRNKEKEETDEKEVSDEKKEAPPEEKATEEVEDSETKVKSRIIIRDEQGKETPLVLEVDGKNIEISDADELKTKGQIWYHHDTKGKELNEKEKELEVGAKLLSEALEKAAQLKVQSAPPQPSDEEQAEEEDEKDLEGVDPELAKTRKELKKSNQKLNALSKVVFDMLIKEERGKIDDEFNALKDDGFKYADKDDVITLMAKRDEKNDPIYTLKEAVKISHEKIAKIVEQETGDKEPTEEQEQKIIAKYLENKAKEEAPVGSPSDTSAGDAPPIPKKDEDGERKGYGSVQGAYEAWRKKFKARQGVARKH